MLPAVKALPNSEEINYEAGGVGAVSGECVSSTNTPVFKQWGR